MHGPLGAAYASSESVWRSYTGTNAIYVDWIGVLPIDIMIKGTAFLERLFLEVWAWNYAILSSWSCWNFLKIVRKRLTLLHRNQWDLCWPTRRITYRYSYEWSYIFGMVVIGGLCMKLCNCVVLEVLLLPVHSQQAFETTTPDPTRFMLTDSAYYLSICSSMELHFWNGSFRRFVHEIMQLCCFGVAVTSCT